MATASDQYFSSLLKSLKLSKAESDAVQKYVQDPSGRGFLPVADVLRSHRLFKESLELLTLGVQNHPTFAVARVVLAREYFNNGMLVEAYELLHHSPIDFKDNSLAQKILFKIGLAFGDENICRQTYLALAEQHSVDQEIRRLHSRMDEFGITRIRDEWRQELASKGIEFDYQSMIDKAIPSEEQQGPSFIKVLGLSFEVPEEERKELAGFHVVGLSEIFQGEASNLDQSNQRSSVELDSTTLAEIYVKQGYYKKSLDIYRRLLRLSPHNDLLRLKVSEVSKLERSQKADVLEEDPVLFDKMETIEILEKQRVFLEGMLTRLGR